ncbi:MAG: hypothetical protein IKW89_06245 [Bacteroidales bacterium]|nr:hypothetical protein [Bacteroidales bacterium]
MRKFLKKTVLFFLGLSLILAVSDYCYSKLYRHVSKPNMEIWKDVMDGDASSGLLICGDSRVNTDCLPHVIDSITGLQSFSLGIIGHHFSIERLSYDMYRRYNDKPVIVVQLVDGWTFSKPSKFERSQFMPWMWNMPFLKEAFKLEPRYFAGISIPWLRYHGEHIYDMKWSRRLTRRGYFKYNADRFFRYPEDQLVLKRSENNEKRFRAYLSELSQEGIKVVLIMAPIYGSSSFSESTLSMTRKLFVSIAEEYGIPVLDYLQRPCFEDSTLFNDSLHLNEKGARVFSDSLANDIMSLGLINN